MTVTFKTAVGRDEQIAYVDDKEVCRIPGTVIIEIQRRLGVQYPKGSMSQSSPTYADGEWFCSHASFDQWCLACAHGRIRQLESIMVVPWARWLPQQTQSAYGC